MKYIFKKRWNIFLISLLDFFGNIVFLPFNLFKKKTPGNIGNILIIRLDHIGDVICSTPVPQNLKKHYRGAKITFLTGSWAKEIVINNPYVDEIICYDASWFNRQNRRVFELMKFLKLAAELRKHNYDIGIDLRGDIRHIILMALAGVKFRVGYGITGGGFLLHKIADYRYDVHAVDHGIDVLKTMNIRISTEKPCIYSSDEDKESIDNLFKENNIKAGDFIVSIHPHAGYPANRWQDSRVAELIEFLRHNYSAKIILIGTDKDKLSNENIIKKSGSFAVNAAGKTSIAGLSVLFERSSLYIGVHSGPMHLANIVDVPMVVLYSGTNNLQDWAPKREKSVVIQKDILCKECQKPECEDNICMDLISVDDVLEAVDKVMGKKI